MLDAKSWSVLMAAADDARVLTVDSGLENSEPRTGKERPTSLSYYSAAGPPAGNIIYFQQSPSAELARK